MNLDNIIDEIVDFIKIKLAENNIHEKVNQDSMLVGSDSLLDSMNLLELCITLEDKAEDNNFYFDWASDDAMSKSRSIFKSPRSLAQEFLSQYEESLK
tara:strand:- start:79 stop:372 length:294 start_codon:yes stop_codon:yes gene_type:complete